MPPFGPLTKVRNYAKFFLLFGRSRSIQSNPVVVKDFRVCLLSGERRMSETQRTMQHVNQEYSQAIARMGEIDYLTNHSFPLELEQLVKKIRKLEQEAKQISKASTNNEPEIVAKTDEEVEKALENANV